MKNGLTLSEKERKDATPLFVCAKAFLFFSLSVFWVAPYLADFITHLKIRLTLVHPTDGHIRASNIAVG